MVLEDSDPNGLRPLTALSGFRIPPWGISNFRTCKNLKTNKYCSVLCLLAIFCNKKYQSSFHNVLEKLENQLRSL